MQSTRLLPLALALTFTPPAIAGVSRNVSVSDALNGRVNVTVASEGGGTILDFSETGETIKKLTIDDPSKVGVDHCLMARSCTDETEPIVRLFRVSIPNPDVPTAKTTQLTVLTRDNSGQWASYIFPVTPSSKPSIYTKYKIGGQTEVIAANPASTMAGLKIARRNRTLVDPKLTGRIKMYAKYRQQGMSQAKAASKAGISKKLIAKLRAMGSTAPPVAQAPVPPVIQKPVQEPAVVEQPELPTLPEVTQKDDPRPVTLVAKSIDPPKQPTALEIANTLHVGLTVAKHRGEIRYRGTVWRKMNSVIRYLRENYKSTPELATASKAAGVQESEVRRFLGKGGLIF